MVNYTFGKSGSGADFETLYDLLDDLHGTTLYDDRTYTQIDDVIESEYISGLSGFCLVNLNGYTLKFTNQTSHGGVVGVGNIIGQGVLKIRPSGTGELVIESLQFNNDSVYNTCVFVLRYSSANYTFNQLIQDCIVNCTGETRSSGISVVEDIRGYVTSKIINCVVSNGKSGISHFNYGGVVNPNACDFYVENCSAYNCSSYGFDTRNGTSSNRTFTLKNNVSVDCGEDFRFLETDVVSWSNNGCSDDTLPEGDGNINNIDPDTEFHSLDIENEDFLKPVSNGLLANAGTTNILAENTMTIDGYTRPYHGYVTIGAILHKFLPSIDGGCMLNVEDQKMFFLGKLNTGNAVFTELFKHGVFEDTVS